MSDAAAFEACIARGGVAVFPADTVYGLACDPDDAQAVARLYAIKGRPPQKPAAVMFFSRDAALRELGQDLGARTRTAFEALLPGGVTLLVANPRGRYAPACGPDIATLGVRVPDVPSLAAVSRAVMQSSANLSGGADARRLEDVPAAVRDAADLVLDGGELPGTPSTVIDLRGFEERAAWAILRPGAVPAERVAQALGAGAPPL